MWENTYHYYCAILIAGYDHYIYSAFIALVKFAYWLFHFLEPFHVFEFFMGLLSI